MLWNVFGINYRGKRR